MTFSIDADAQNYFPVAACNDLYLPTGIRAGFVPVPPNGCSGCPRYGTSQHQGAQRVKLTGDIDEIKADLLAIVAGRLTRAGQYQAYLKYMDLARGVLETSYAIDGGNASQTYGPWTCTVGSNLITADLGENGIPPPADPYGVARLDGVQGEWVIARLDTSGISLHEPDEGHSGEYYVGSFNIHTMTPLKNTSLTGAATVVSIYAYTTRGLPQFPPMVFPGGESFTNPACLPAQLLRAGPRFCLEQVAPGDPESFVLRSLGLGLDNLAGEPNDAAEGAGIAKHEHDLLLGGWGGKILNYTDPTSGAARTAYLPGLEVLRQRLDGASVDFDDPATWPGIGPAGGAQGAPKTGYGQVPDETNDPHGRLALNALEGGSRTVHRYNHGAGATMRHQPRYVGTSINFPKTADTAALQTFGYGTVQYGTFDLTAYGAGAYAGLLRVRRPHSYNTAKAFPTFATRRTPMIHSITVNEDGTADIFLEHALATLLKADGSEIDVKIGGGHVALPQHYLTDTQPMRCNNPGSDQCVNGDGFPDRIEAGDLLSFNHESIPEALRITGLAVIAVEACAGPEAFTNPAPDVGSGEYTIGDDGEWYDANVATLPGVPPGGYLRRCDKITVMNEPIGVGLLGGMIDPESLIGLALPVLREATLVLPGTATVRHGSPTTSDGAASGMTFAAAGLFYLNSAYPGECLTLPCQLLQGGRLTSVTNFWAAATRALRAVMGVRTWSTQVAVGYDGRLFQLDAFFDDWYYQTPIPDNAWKEGTTYYWTNNYAGDGPVAHIGSRLETASPYHNQMSVICEYYNPMAPFHSDDLHRFPWASDAVSGAYAELAIPNLSITMDRIESLWSAEPMDEGAGWVNIYGRGTQELIYCYRATTGIDITDTMPLTPCLLGVTYHGAEPPTYAALATAGGGTVNAGTLQSYDVTELAKAMMDHRDEYSDFLMFLGVGDLTVTPDQVDGRTFMKSILGKTYKRDGEMADGYFIGTIEATRIEYGVAVLGGGVLECNPDQMPLPV